MAIAVSVCEAHNEVARIVEELELLPKEMQAHLSYYRSLETRLTQFANALAAEQGTTSDLLQAVGYTVLQGRGRYQPGVDSIVSDAAVRSGVLTFVGLAQFEVQQQLKKAVNAFAAAGLPGLTIDPSVHVDASEEGDVGVDSQDGDVGVDSEDGDMQAPSDGMGDAD